eukprot:scaffold923_cov256-Pinguiococcus_pyrenoidosus.AAC.33
MPLASMAVMCETTERCQEPQQRDDDSRACFGPGPQTGPRRRLSTHQTLVWGALGGARGSDALCRSVH